MWRELPRQASEEKDPEKVIELAEQNRRDIRRREMERTTFGFYRALVFLLGLVVRLVPQYSGLNPFRRV